MKLTSKQKVYKVFVIVVIALNIAMAIMLTVGSPRYKGWNESTGQFTGTAAEEVQFFKDLHGDRSHGQE